MYIYEYAHEYVHIRALYVQVRVVAARALVPLVAADRVGEFLVDLAAGLPACEAWAVLLHQLTLERVPGGALVEPPLQAAAGRLGASGRE